MNGWGCFRQLVLYQLQMFVNRKLVFFLHCREDEKTMAFSLYSSTSRSKEHLYSNVEYLSVGDRVKLWKADKSFRRWRIRIHHWFHKILKLIFCFNRGLFRKWAISNKVWLKVVESEESESAIDSRKFWSWFCG